MAVGHGSTTQAGWTRWLPGIATLCSYEARWLVRDREDARQIVANVTGIFSLLGEWSRAEMPPPGE